MASAVAACMTPSPSSVSAVPIATTTSTKAPAASPSASMPNRLDACSTIACRIVITTETGRISTPIPMNRRSREAYMRAAAERIWPHARRCASRNGAVGRQVARVRPYDDERQRGQHARDGRPRVADRPPQQPRAAGHGAAEEVGGARPRRPAGRHGVGAVAPALRPADRLCPLLLQVGAGGAVEEGRLLLAPAALEPDPGEPRGRLRRVAGDRLHRRVRDQPRVPGVVAARHPAIRTRPGTGPRR